MSKNRLMGYAPGDNLPVQTVQDGKTYVDGEEVPELSHTHTYTTVTKWDHHASRYTGILDYSEALEVMCSGCLERKLLEETV